jgi:hypothetical protein
MCAKRVVAATIPLIQTTLANVAGWGVNKHGLEACRMIGATLFVWSGSKPEFMAKNRQSSAFATNRPKLADCALALIITAISK